MCFYPIIQAVRAAPFAILHGSPLLLCLRPALPNLASTQTVSISNHFMSSAYISRTPIYDRKLETFGYELRLFGNTGDRSFISLAGLAGQIDLSRLAGTNPVLIRPHREELEELAGLPWPHGQIMVALSSDALNGAGPPAAIAGLLGSGFALAIDEPPSVAELPFTEGVSLCMVAARRLGHWRNGATVGIRQPVPKLLTRELETAHQYEESIKLGFDLFQGEFFEKPRLMRGRDLAANRLQTLQLLARLQDPDVSIEEVTTLVKQDLTLSYKLLRMLNSAFFGIPKQVESISRAVVFFGLQRIKNWATVLLVNSTEFQPREMLITAMIRARMCERLATSANRSNPERYYLAGLFSLLDSIMDAPIETILASLGLASEIDEALLTGGGPVGEVLTTVRHFEQGRPDFRAGIAVADDMLLQQAYLEAVEWAHNTYRHMG